MSKPEKPASFVQRNLDIVNSYLGQEAPYKKLYEVDYADLKKAAWFYLSSKPITEEEKYALHKKLSAQLESAYGISYRGFLWAERMKLARLESLSMRAPTLEFSEQRSHSPSSLLAKVSDLVSNSIIRPLARVPALTTSIF